ncbi:MAG: DUF1223 domain-containing protein [Pseudomonadota bacterium]
MTRPILSFLAAGLLSLGAAQQSVAGDVVVVELFTSQGCSSCPPADALLAELSQRDDVVALSLHVDYWDYLGWKDEFAIPAHTQRQQGYAQAVGSSMIYTPQMVINGKDHVVGTKAMALADSIQAHFATDNQVSLAVQRRGSGASLSLTPQTALPSDLLVHLVRYAPERTVKIRSGENAGRAITYHNVVTSWETLAQWDGQGAVQIDAELAGEDAAAFLVQDGVSGPILAAARLD